MDKYTIITVLVIAFCLEYSSAIRCYRCTVLPNRDPKEKNHFCTKFEETDEYIVDCPYSTMCMKKIFRMRLIDNVTETLIRDCAIQKYTEQVYANGSWHKEYSVEEPYNEGCTTHEATVYCHCRGALCNTGTKVELTTYHVDAVAVIVAFNFIKYFKRIEY